MDVPAQKLERALVLAKRPRPFTYREKEEVCALARELFPGLINVYRLRSAAQLVMQLAAEKEQEVKHMLEAAAVVLSEADRRAGTTPAETVDPATLPTAEALGIDAKASR